jgi:hypothetical protein
MRASIHKYEATFMAARKKTKTAKVATIPAHPRVPLPHEIGELCADIYRNGVLLARRLGADEQMVEQMALDDVRHFMAACIKQSKADWKSYTKSTGVLSAFVSSKRPVKKKTR